MAAHNLIIGTPYIDVTDKCVIKNLKTGEEAVINYHERGWN
jgi:hypothetical protein